MEKIVTLPFDAAAESAGEAAYDGARAAYVLWPVIAAALSVAYATGRRADVFRADKPQSGLWAKLHEGKKSPSKGFRAMLTAHVDGLGKGRALTQEAHDEFIMTCAGTFDAAAAPVKPSPRPQAEKDAAALQRAVTLLQGAAATLSDEQADALSAMLAARAAHIAATAKPATAKPAKPATAKPATAKPATA
jgi:hypothetical protein